MSSELSNALNPNVVTSRRTNHPRPNAADPVEKPPPPARPAAVPHRSELELAITEPPPPSVVAPQRPNNPPSRQTAAVQELLRVLSTTKEAAALERQRRHAWEKEQEAKLIQRQAEMERQMLEMRQELTLLKAQASLQSPGPSPAAVSPISHSPTPTGDTGTPPLPVHPTQLTLLSRAPFAHPSLDAGHPSPSYRPDALLTPSDDSSPHQTPFLHAQGMLGLGSEAGSASSPQLTLSSPSSANVLVTPEPSPRLRVACPVPHPTGVASLSQFVGGSPAQSYVTPGHSPSISVVDEHCSGDAIYTPPHAVLRSTPASEMQGRSLFPSSVVLGKRRTSPASSGDNSAGSEDEDGPGSTSSIYSKRYNGHDKRCLTIHHAMRTHILRCMHLSDDKHLPDSHVEGEALPSSEPVRFIWEKTAKQSSHNAAMKRRIVVDLQENRTLYKHVPEEDFAPRNLENVFDQAFTTLRQKFKAQRDVTAAAHHKRREDQKAMRTRRLNRKKTKLANRIDARKRLGIFSHPTFDSALQQECMSSEESCDDIDGGGGEAGSLQNKSKVLQTRKLPWRSLRLQRFYAMLDEEDLADRSSKPRRGIGRIERIVGPDKDPSELPPMNASRWMISKRWVRLVQCTLPKLVPTVSALVSVPDGLGGDEYAVLGNESDDDADLQEVVRLDRQIPVSETSSLQHALTPTS